MAIQIDSFYSKNSSSDIKRLIQEYPDLKFAIVSSVLNHSKELTNMVSHKLNCIEFNQSTKIPIKNLYKSPDSLGNDRLAGAVGGYSKFIGKNTLIIDCGTCIKYDFVNENAEYLGGAISPGLEMRFKALNNFTDRLPLLSIENDFESFVGKTTQESILSGVQNGVLQELKGVIKQYKLQFPGIKVILTGGDWQFFENALKNSIFAAPFLILEGLNEILNFNVENKKK